MQKIETMRIVREAFRFTNRNLAVWFAMAFLPMALNGAVILGYYALFGNRGGGLLADFLRNLLALTIYVPFLTAWIRMTLLGRDRARGVTGYAFRAAESRFLGLFLLAFLFFFVGSIVGSALTLPLLAGAANQQEVLMRAAVINLALMIGLAFVVLRWSLSFPAAAIGERLGFKASWKLTRKSGWRIFLALAIVFLPLLAVAVIVISFVGLEYVFSGGYVFVELAMLVPGYYIAAIMVSALAMIYWHLTDYDPSTFDPEAIRRR